MNHTEAIAALRAVQSHHKTAHGVLIGFFMKDATAALGSFEQASNTLARLMVDALIASSPVVVDGDVKTIYCIADATPPASRSVH